jgi:hypothetical protein
MSRKRAKSKPASTSNSRRGSGPGVRITAPAALVGVGGLLVSGVGVADAATGGNFLLGKSNSASAVTTLTNSKGTPLSLKAKSGSPPLAVNSSKLVPKLNANFLNGLSSAQVQRRVSGSCAATGIKAIGSTGAVLCSSPDQIVFTASGTFTVPAGITHLTGDLWGGGGGAGYQLGGGGSGAYESVLLTVSPGDVVHVTVGPGGTGTAGSGTNGGNTTLSINSGAAIANAGGGSGGSYPCGPVAGGTAATPSAPALGLNARSGSGGDCGVAGNPGFAGGGGPLYHSPGTNGLVIISLDH